jgi:MFS family permease
VQCFSNDEPIVHDPGTDLGYSLTTSRIVFRALQGIGGSALYSLVFVAIIKLIVPEKIAFYSGVISSVFALANLSGPLIGGAISDHTNWRWIFWLNGYGLGYLHMVDVR